jgi:predicted ATPase
MESEIISVPDLHDKILEHLLKWRGEDDKRTFALRKSDMRKRLTAGYWFYGNDDYIALSFWSGMDWQSKMPNISFVLNLKHKESYLQFSVQDSTEKADLVKKYFVERFELNEKYSSIYCSKPKIYTDIVVEIKRFLEEKKFAIDLILFENLQSFQTKQNRYNRILFIRNQEFSQNLNRIYKFKNNSNKNVLPSSLAQIKILNYGLIKNLDLELPPDVQWIFFTGENGTGKTTILKALTTAINAGKIRVGNKNKVQKDYRIELALFKNGIKKRKRIIRRIEPLDIKEGEILTRGFVAFGPIRLNVDDPIYTTHKKNRPALIKSLNKPYIQIFNTSEPIIDLSYVVNRSDQYEKILSGGSKKYPFIVETIISICETIADIRIDKILKYYEVDKNKKPINEGTHFRDLASGYKNIVALISHMMLILYYQQPEIDDTALLEGIVVIDEIDLHFHPKMQRDLVIKLSEIFPRIQFIASTHSPIPLLGAPKNTVVFTTNVDAEKGVFVKKLDSRVNLQELLPNSIYTSPIFNFQDIISHSHSSDMLLDTEDDFNDIVFYKILDSKLKQIEERYKSDD